MRTNQRGKNSSHKHPPSSSSAAAAKPRQDPTSDNPPNEPPKNASSDPKPSPAPKNDGKQPITSPPDAGGPGSPYPPRDHPIGLGGGGGVAPPPPAYGFHMLERRTIVLADGSVRSYFALPLDYPMDPAADRFFPYGGPIPGRGMGPEHGLGLGFDKHFPHPGLGGRLSPEGYRDQPYWAGGADGLRGGPQEGPSSLKRKFGEEDEYARRRQHIAQYGNPNLNPNGVRGEFGDYIGRSGSPSRRGLFEDERLSKHLKLGGDGYGDGPLKKDGGDDEGEPVVLDVNPEELKKAYLKYAKMIHENAGQRVKYLEDGKNGNLSCAACGRPSKEFSDVHRLIMHAYTCSDSRIDHLGLHKALCVLMGWNYAKVPDNGKAYQSLPAKDAAANREDLIVWPPHVILHNTSTGKRKDGRVEGMGNKETDNWLREAGFGSGKAKSMYGKEGHLGITIVKFADGEAGLREAERLGYFLAKNNHGREGWALAQASQSTHGSDGNPLLAKLDENGEEKRILYGFVALASDLDKIEFDTRRKLSVRSRNEFGSSG